LGDLIGRLPKFSKYGGTTMICAVTSSTCSQSPAVGTDTPSRRGRIRFVEDLPMAAGHERQESLEGCQVADRRDGPEITLEILSARTS
jgi:hypothetical protein